MSFSVLFAHWLPPTLAHDDAARLNAALREPEMARRVAEMGSPDVAGTPEAFRALIASETEKWRKVLAGAGDGAPPR